ncbi:BTB/POZ domain-containing protein At3g05675-like isoform X2 [Wolffia australiana]
MGELGDLATSDVIIRLKNSEGRPELYHCHSSILSKKSKFFKERFSSSASTTLEIPCFGAEYDHHVSLLKLLYQLEDPPWESWGSIAAALGILRAAINLGCEGITQSCVHYLEAIPWDEEEEDEILKAAMELGPAAAPILARIQPVEQSASKQVLMAAIHFAATGDDELKISAQEQVEFMLAEDEEAEMLAGDEDVKAELRADIGGMFSNLVEAMSLLPGEEVRALHLLSDLDWLCNILPKLDMMKDFVARWVDSSEVLLDLVQGERLGFSAWEVKAKLVELAGRGLEAVGYGAVVVPAPARVRLLKAWLPFLQKTKVGLEAAAAGDESFGHSLDGEICQGIEGAVVSLVLALPSKDQAEILTEWMSRSSRQELAFPNLSEAFEVWCYRAKAAKRRLAMGIDGIGSS